MTSDPAHYPLIDFFNDLLSTTILISFDYPGYIVQALNLRYLALEVRTH